MTSTNSLRKCYLESGYRSLFRDRLKGVGMRHASFHHSCDRLVCKFSGLGHLELCWNVPQEGRMKNRCEKMDGRDEKIGFSSRDKA